MLLPTPAFLHFVDGAHDAEGRRRQLSVLSVVLESIVTVGWSSDCLYSAAEPAVLLLVVGYDPLASRCACLWPWPPPAEVVMVSTTGFQDFDGDPEKETQQRSMLLWRRRWFLFPLHIAASPAGARRCWDAVDRDRVFAMVLLAPWTEANAADVVGCGWLGVVGHVVWRRRGFGVFY